MDKIRDLDTAAAMVADGDVIAVNSSSGLCCPDALLQAIGNRFDQTGSPKNITSIHPIAAGDMFGTRGVDHIAKRGLLASIIGGSYPSGPSNLEPPLIWQMVLDNCIPAYNLPSGVICDMLRESAAKRPGVLTKVGIDTFVDPALEGGAMNDAAKQKSIVKRVSFEGDEWLYFPSIGVDIALIRATSADERGNLTFEHEGAVLGAMEMALAAHNNGGKVIAQVKRIVKQGTMKSHEVVVPGIIVDTVVEVPGQLQTTATVYDPEISGEVFRPLGYFKIPDFSPAKIIARRIAQELQEGWVVNIGFGIAANVPRIFLEEGLHGSVTWVIEQGAVGGIPLLDFSFGCSANAEAFVAAPHQFSYFQAAGFNASLLSFLEIDQEGSVNVSRLPAMPHRTAGSGGFIDITCRAKNIIFSGNFNAGAKLSIVGGALRIDKEGKIPKLVKKVNQVSFSGKKALEQNQKVTYVTERCVLQLTDKGVVVTEIAPGVNIKKDILSQADFPLGVADDVKTMDAALFTPQPVGMRLIKH